MNLPFPIERPTLLLNKVRTFKNIQRMSEKVLRSKVIFRPHFKTHQSAEIGKWFKNFGVRSITVSSLDMAQYFAKNNWNDITVAFPVNILEIKKINELASQVDLGLLVESSEVVQQLGQKLQHNVNIWIKIDVGAGRTGIFWKKFSEILNIVKEIDNYARMNLSGILTHAGQSYRAKSRTEIEFIYYDQVQLMLKVKEYLSSNGIEKLKISIGDTPCCSIVDNFAEVDEIRPGNFVFYDTMQLQIGSCSEEDIAVAVACPIVAIHENKYEIIVYGGAVHLSKDFIISQDNTPIYGYVATPNSDGWGRILPETYVAGLSQEHGIIKSTPSFIKQVAIGDSLIILPVHSCLTVNQMREYYTIKGKRIKTRLS